MKSRIKARAPKAPTLRQCAARLRAVYPENTVCVEHEEWLHRHRRGDEFVSTYRVSILDSAGVRERGEFGSLGELVAWITRLEHSFQAAADAIFVSSFAKERS